MALRKKFPSYLVWRIENSASNGLPDILIIPLKSLTLGLEVKYAKPDFKSKGDQELMMLRMAQRSLAYYVVFYEVEKEKRTYIVYPKDIGKPLESWTNVRPGFAYDWVCSFVGEIYGGNYTIR